MHRGLTLLTAAWTVLALCACAPEKPPEPPRNPTAEAKALVQGMGPAATCRNDRDCVVGKVQASCTLGTCFGLLTTDERPVRSLLVSRLADADRAVQQAAKPLLRAALESDVTTTGQKLAALAGLGELLRHDDDPDLRTAVRAMTGDRDANLAAAARLALGLSGDPTVRAGLLDDLRQGTELLRAEAARSLQPVAGEADVRRALVAALADPSPAVQMAVLTALAGQTRDPSVAAGMRELAAHVPGLAYEVGRLGVDLAAPATGGTR